MQGGNLNHMGIDRTPGKPTPAYANEHRSWEIYRDMFENLVFEIQPWLSRKSKPSGFKGKLFSVDSTTIDLCLSVYPWAKFHHKKGAVKVHTVLDHDGLIPVFADTTHGRVHDTAQIQRGLQGRWKPAGIACAGLSYGTMKRRRSLSFCATT